MSEKPTISAVLPTHNGEKYLGESIQSLLDQSYPNWELIVVDDGSTDSTLRIARTFAMRDSRIRLISNQINQGLPVSLNRGFQEARGEFYSWTSDDNLYRSNALEEMVEILRSRAEIDIVYSDYSTLDHNGNVTRSVQALPPERLPFINGIGPCFLFKRCVFEELGGYRAELFLVEDYDFWLRAYAKFRFHHHPEDMYLYRQHQGSLTKQHSERIAKLTKAVRRANMQPLISRLHGQAAADAHFFLARQMLDDGYRVQSLAQVIDGFFNAPVFAIRFRRSIIVHALLGTRLAQRLILARDRLASRRGDV